MAFYRHDKINKAFSLQRNLIYYCLNSVDSCSADGLLRNLPG